MVDCSPLELKKWREMTKGLGGSCSRIVRNHLIGLMIGCRVGVGKAEKWESNHPRIIQ